MVLFAALVLNVNLYFVSYLQKLNNKMVAKKRSGFPFGTVLLVLAFTISAVVLYDVKKSGSWESKLSQSLRI